MHSIISAPFDWRQHSATHAWHADELDPEQLRALARLRGGQPVVRISHQPNLFAGMNICGLILAAEKLAQESGGVVVFVAVDYDSAGDQRFRSPLLPPIRGHHVIHIKGGVSKADRNKVAFTVPAPTAQVVHDWVHLHKQALARLGGQVRGPDAYGVLDPAYIEHLRQQARSLVDFNISLLANLCRHLQCGSVIFARASQYLGPAGSAINNLIKAILSRGARHARALVWRVCPVCYERCHSLPRLKDGVVYCKWRCDSCGKGAEDILDWKRRLSGVPQWPAFVPKVLLCDFIDYAIVRADKSISYAGSQAHLIAARTLYQLYFPALAIPPDYLWRPTHLPAPAGQGLEEQWRNGRFSAYLYCALFDATILRRHVLQSGITLPKLSYCRGS